MAIQKVTEIEGGPIVGKYYLVPCVVNTKGKILPILHTSHRDPELGVSALHYHYDTRFLSRTHLREIGTGNMQRAMLMVAAAQKYFDFFKHGKLLPIIAQKFLCKREMQQFPFSTKATKEFRQFEASYQNTKLNCNTCPHRGMKLDGLPQVNGNVICPLHGLQWNMQSKELVPRYNHEASL